MTKSDILITPWLPDNLESIHKNEEELRTQSILQINADSKLKDQFDIIHKSLNLVFDLTTAYKHESADELTLQYLGIRLFNSTVTSIKLLLAGYYQSSVVLQRDILETGFLLDFFLSSKEKIVEWRESSSRDRQRRFNPAVIRKALDERDGFEGRKREEVYKLMCEYATHPSYQGFIMVSPQGLGKIGPFLDKKYLKHTIEELALHVPLFVLIYMSHFEDLPPQFLKVKADYLVQLKNWAQNYLGLDLSQIDAEKIKEWTTLL